MDDLEKNLFQKDILLLIFIHVIFQNCELHCIKMEAEIKLHLTAWLDTTGGMLYVT